MRHIHVGRAWPSNVLLSFQVPADSCWLRIHIGVRASGCHPCFNSKRGLRSIPSRGRQATLDGQAMLSSEERCRELNRALRSPMKMFHSRGLLNLRADTIAKSSAVWTEHVSYPILVGSLSPTGAAAEREEDRHSAWTLMVCHSSYRKLLLRRVTHALRIVLA